MILGSDSALSIQGIPLSSAGGVSPFLLATGRGQKLRAYCATDDGQTGSNFPVGVPVLASKGDGDPLEEAEPATQIVDGRLVVTESPLKPALPPPALSAPQKLLAESATFRDPLSLIRTGRRSAVLWGVQKNGNLLVFDARPFLSALTGACRQS